MPESLRCTFSEFCHAGLLKLTASGIRLLQREGLRRAPGQFACGSCGNLVPSPQPPTTKCSRCGEQEWQPASK